MAYELLREVLLPDLLGKELPSILYWAGKSIARKYPVSNEEEVIQFFKDAGWGNLAITSQKANIMEFDLTSEFINARNQSRKETSYNLEAGFIAQQFEQINNVITEAFVEQKKRHNLIHITVKSDSKDNI
ncbi:YslB family protein [Bacillus sp. RD4P76]|uniref:YslB family protein n=1 Tax=Bacillus suaedaesalsae TaxID=2810349 RepID=A0ABS2DMR6_9BACI|nr:YslB family protein [Bacillus suaedaesalsae]